MIKIESISIHKKNDKQLGQNLALYIRDETMVRKNEEYSSIFWGKKEGRIKFCNPGCLKVRWNGQMISCSWVLALFATDYSTSLYSQ